MPFFQECTAFLPQFNLVYEHQLGFDGLFQKGQIAWQKSIKTAYNICSCQMSISAILPLPTHIKISQLIASLQTSHQQVVFAQLVTNCQQVWNKLLTTCNNLVDIVRIVTSRLGRFFSIRKNTGFFEEPVFRFCQTLNTGKPT